MGIEIVIPVILCVMTGVFVTLWYLRSEGRISRQMCMGLGSVFLVLCVLLSWLTYQKHKEDERLALEVEQQQAAATRRVRPGGKYSASVLLHAGRLTPDTIASQMQGQIVTIGMAYLVGVTGSEGHRVFLLSGEPEPVSVDGTSIYFFGVAKDRTVARRLEKMPKGRPFDISAVFAGFDKITKKDGKTVHMFLINIHGIEEKQ